VLDGFSGTTRVAQAFSKRGYRVICNDIAVWTEIFGSCYLLNQRSREAYFELIQHLNGVKSFDGWFTENYGGSANSGSALQVDGYKKPWQVHNTRKLDAIRTEIDLLNLLPVEKAVAISSLILALDQVDNTMGHFVSYLQEWSPRSFNDLTLKVPSLFIPSEPNQVYRGDIFDLVPNLKVDLAYFDPPYGSNNEKMPPSRVRYASYYHLWTTVALNDKPELFGKAKRRVDSSDHTATSIFEEYRRNENDKFITVEAIERLLQQTNAKWMILSYSSGGRATAQELADVISSSGTVIDLVKIDYKKNVMSGMKWTNEWLRETETPNQEYLFLIEKT
jgi:adenine-specific DNA-methyltransferase